MRLPLGGFLFLLMLGSKRRLKLALLVSVERGADDQLRYFLPGAERDRFETWPNLDAPMVLFDPVIRYLPL